jgi:cysteine-rich repeat protein
MSGDGCDQYCKVEDGYTCTGEPSDCSKPTGACTDPLPITLTADNTGTLKGVATGDTTMAMNTIAEADCNGYPAGGGHDNVWKFTLTDTRDVQVLLEMDPATTFDGTLRLLATSCDLASELTMVAGLEACGDVEGNGGDLMLFSALPPGTYYVVVDGYTDQDMGKYTLDVIESASKCGDGHVDQDINNGLYETCDDGNTMSSDGCSANCNTEPGYVCTTDSPSVCTSACGNNQLDPGEECDDGNTMAHDRCSATCTLEYDTMENEPSNDTTPQVITATNHIIRGTLPTETDVDLYTFTITAPSTVQLETYDSMDPQHAYTGVGVLLPNVDCGTADTRIYVFDAAGDVTNNDTALAFDDDDGDGYCSYIGPHDSAMDDVPNDIADTNQGVLPPGTYTIKVVPYPGSSSPLYILDVNIASTNPAVAPVPGDLVLNEFMAADNVSDTNCDGLTTGTKDEFVELVNVSSKVLDITGLTISDSLIVRHTFAAAVSGSMTLDPGKAVVVWGGGAPNCPGVNDWFVASTGQLGLNDDGDTITLKDANGNQLLTHTYPAATLNKSFNLTPDVTGTTYALHGMVPGAVGDYSPGKHANGTAF